MKKIKLVENRAAIKKRWSVKIIKVGAAAFTAWGALTAAGLVSTVPPWVPQAVAALGFVGAFLAAYLAQPDLPETGKP
jgi:hypothetical protein